MCPMDNRVQSFNSSNKLHHHHHHRNSIMHQMEAAMDRRRQRPILNSIRPIVIPVGVCLAIPPTAITNWMVHKIGTVHHKHNMVNRFQRHKRHNNNRLDWWAIMDWMVHTNRRRHRIRWAYTEMYQVPPVAFQVFHQCPHFRIVHHRLPLPAMVPPMHQAPLQR